MSHPQNPQNTPQQQSPQPQHQWSPQHQTPHNTHHQQAPQNYDPQQWAPAQNAPAYGAGGSYPQQPYGQKPPKQKKPLMRRWWFWLLVVIVIIIIASAIGGGGDDTSTSEGGSTDAQQSGESAEKKAADQPAEEASYGIGDTVTADDWEVTVASVDDGVSRVGDEYLGAEAQGQFVQIELSVKNTGSEPNYFFEDDIKLGDDSGNTYSADSEAGIYAAEDNILFLEEINPGNTAKGVLVFDVPEDVDANRLTFAGGLFSDPVEISLK